jgi:hypothetical protein
LKLIPVKGPDRGTDSVFRRNPEITSIVARLSSREHSRGESNVNPADQQSDHGLMCAANFDLIFPRIHLHLGYLGPFNVPDVNRSIVNRTAASVDVSSVARCSA